MELFYKIVLHIPIDLFVTKAPLVMAITRRQREDLWKLIKKEGIAMKLIEKLSDMIEEELGDAEKYIRCAMNQKDEHPALAQTFARLSNEEMTHVALLHDQVVALISEYRKEHGDPPEKMLGIYEYLHRKHTDHANEIKVLQALFKG